MDAITSTLIVGGSQGTGPIVEMVLKDSELKQAWRCVCMCSVVCVCVCVCVQTWCSQCLQEIPA